MPDDVAHGAEVDVVVAGQANGAETGTPLAFGTVPNAGQLVYGWVAPVCMSIEGS